MAIAWVALSAGCLSRWSGCRTYDTGHLEGPGWRARVECEPHTDLNLRSAGPVLRGCSAGWKFVVERGGRSASAPLDGPRRQARDCGEVRDFCKDSRGELAARATAVGTWVAGRPPEGGTRVAFVSTACEAVYVLPPDVAPARAPADAVRVQLDGPSYLDGIIAHGPIVDGAWPLVCGDALASRAPAVRAAMLECRAPDTVAEELFRRDPGSVDVAWRAFILGQLPCGARLREVVLRVAPDRAGALAQETLARCDVGCPAGERSEALYIAGRVRLVGARDVTRRIAAEGPPAPLRPDATATDVARYADAYRVWVHAQWALTRIDPQAGVEVGAATLRRIPVREGLTSVPRPGEGPPSSGGDDAAGDLCAILAGADSPATRELLWGIASDESVGVGARQRALLTLARLRDPRAAGQGLAHNPLTAEQAAAVADALNPRTGGTSGGGHHGHHWH